MRNVDDAVEIHTFIPPMQNGGAHHVISRGQRPDFYRPEELRDKGPGLTGWVDEFQKKLVGLYWVLGADVPYAFRTPDGTLRSLDAGCIKMMFNRHPPDIEIEVDNAGFVDRVRPSLKLLELYAPLRERLLKQFTDATAND